MIGYNSSIIVSNNCQLHRQQYQSLSLSLNQKTNTYKACKQCEDDRQFEKFFSFKEIQQKLGISTSCDKIKQIVQISQEVIRQTEVEMNKLKRLAEEISEIIMNGIYQIFSFQVNDQAGYKCPFSAQEMHHLLTPSTTQTFELLINRQISLLNADDMSSMLLTKILFMDQSKDFINLLKINTKGMQKQMQQKFNNLSKTKEQIKKEQEYQQEYQQLQHQEMDDNQQIIDEQIIQNIKGEKRQIGFEYSAIPQVKAIMNIDEKQLAYAKMECVYILDKKNEFKEIHKLSPDGQEDMIQYACSFSAMGEKFIAVGIEQADDKGKIIIWKLQGQQWVENNKIIFEKSIQKIIHYIDQQIITYSEDKKIQHINFKANKQMIIYEEQETINDMALLGPSTLIYITSSKIIAFDLTNKQLLDTVEFEDCCCLEIMNSKEFVIGTEQGKVLICSFSDKIKHQTKDIHTKDIKFICRIDQMKFITSSYDGQHAIVNLNGEKLKFLKEGPKMNFPDPILWDKDQKCLIASNGGYIFLYN